MRITEQDVRSHHQTSRYVRKTDEDETGQFGYMYLDFVPMKDQVLHTNQVSSVTRPPNAVGKLPIHTSYPSYTSR